MEDNRSIVKSGGADTEHLSFRLFQQPAEQRERSSAVVYRVVVYPLRSAVQSAISVRGGELSSPVAVLTRNLRPSAETSPITR